MVFCLRRNAELSVEEFHRYWREDHAALVRRHAPALKIQRYIQNYTIHDPRIAGPLAARGNEIEPYDGVAELWWGSIDALMAVGSTDEGREASRALLEDERKFIDLGKSPIFYTEEHIFIA